MCCNTSNDVICGSTAKERNSTGCNPSYFCTRKGERLNKCHKSIACTSHTLQSQHKQTFQLIWWQIRSNSFIIKYYLIPPSRTVFSDPLVTMYDTYTIPQDPTPQYSCEMGSLFHTCPLVSGFN